MRKKILLCAVIAVMQMSGCAADTDKETKHSTYIPPDTVTEAGADDASDNISSNDSDTVTGAAQIPDTPPAEDSANSEVQIYDTIPIAAAYLTGDSSELDEMQTAILDKAAAVIEECVTEDMSLYQKELAIHDWMIRYCTYDKGELRAIPQPGEHASDPYGVLIDGEAICMGYTTTFKLFMEMLEIPCGIVHSTDDEGDEHAWNTVQLDGSWYYVDTTWDDPVPDRPDRDIKHQYFNITYDEMAIRHVLPDDAPPTDSTAWLFATQEMAVITDYSQIADAVRTAVGRGYSDAVLYFDMPDTDLNANTGLSGKDQYFFSDEEMKNAVKLACLDAGCEYIYSSLRETDRGTALMINFSKA